ncbi:MAG TPA: GyrI-like domain-containing protein, partial [Anaerolineae bacterium]|nr:GyrI-like domain-containing protein [Anaerolineae bacterium]
AVELVEKGKNPPALSKVRLKNYQEGLAVQILHIGSFDDEGPTLVRLHQDYMPANNYVENGKHHEIYLSDPRKVAPEKLKTVLRQPVIKAG